jgi:hypothetical protein
MQLGEYTKSSLRGLCAAMALYILYLFRARAGGCDCRRASWPAWCCIGCFDRAVDETAPHQRPTPLLLFRRLAAHLIRAFPQTISAVQSLHTLKQRESLSSAGNPYPSHTELPTRVASAAPVRTATNRLTMSSTGAMPMPTPDRVRKRVAEACAFCRRRKVRLSASLERAVAVTEFHRSSAARNGLRARHARRTTRSAHTRAAVMHPMPPVFASPSCLFP